MNGFSCNLQRFFGAKQKVAERLARFRQVNLEQASMHHDALEFSNGKIILLARLSKDTTRSCCSCRLRDAPRTKRSGRSAVLSLPDRATRYRACLAVEALEKSHRGADGSSTARARQQNGIAERGNLAL